MNDFHNLNIVSLVVGVTGIIAGASGVVLNFLNKDRYKTQIDVYRPENDELRAINSRKTAQISDLQKQNEIMAARSEEKDVRLKEIAELNSRQPDFEKLVGLMSNNHREVIIKLTELTKRMAGKIESKK